MNVSKDYDLIVIGFGKAGKTLADQVAPKNYKVAVIEKDKNMYGGTCINVACLPTKSLIHRAKLLEIATRMGICNIDRKQFYKDSIAEKNRMTSIMREKNYHKLADNNNIDVINGEAHFVDENHIKVLYENGNEEVIFGKVIVINTGGKPRSLNLPGFEGNKNIHDSRSILELTKLPKHLGIIGAGYIGIEYSAYFRAFGSEVTVFQKNNRFLSREDAKGAAAVRDRLEKIGVKFIFNAKAESVEKLNDKSKEYNISLKYSQNTNGVEEKKSLDFSELLIATGRIPYTEGLQLNNCGVKVGEQGQIVVDDSLRTSQNHIFAVGDVKGGPQFTFVSLDDFRIVLPQIMAILEKNDLSYHLHHNKSERPVFPNTTFIDPPYSRIGLTEEEAKIKYNHVKIKTIPAAAIPKAQVVQETEGFLKVIINEDTDLILGAVLFCYESQEMINLFTLAINEKITATRLKDLIYNHPVMSEALNELFN